MGTYYPLPKYVDEIPNLAKNRFMSDGTTPLISRNKYRYGIVLRTKQVVKILEWRHRDGKEYMLLEFCSDNEEVVDDVPHEVVCQDEDFLNATIFVYFPDGVSSKPESFCEKWKKMFKRFSSTRIKLMEEDFHQYISDLMDSLSSKVSLNSLKYLANSATTTDDATYEEFRELNFWSPISYHIIKDEINNNFTGNGNIRGDRMILNENLNINKRSFNEIRNYVVISDVHLNDYHFLRRGMEYLEQFVRRMESIEEKIGIRTREERDSTLLVVAGDLTDCGTRAEFLLFRLFLCAIGYRNVIVTPGNHDLSSYYGNFNYTEFQLKYFFDILLGIDDDDIILEYFPFPITINREVNVYVLNSCEFRPGNWNSLVHMAGGDFSDGQIRRLKPYFVGRVGRELREDPYTKLTFFVFHHAMSTIFTPSWQEHVMRRVTLLKRNHENFSAILNPQDRDNTEKLENVKVFYGHEHEHQIVRGDFGEEYVMLAKFLAPYSILKSFYHLCFPPTEDFDEDLLVDGMIQGGEVEEEEIEGEDEEGSGM